MDFEQLAKDGQTVIYKESDSTLDSSQDWELWGERIDDDGQVYVYRKIVTFEEANQFAQDNNS